MRKESPLLTPKARPAVARAAQILIVSVAIFSLACAELKTPSAVPYYSETAPPPKQEFRWSNGKLPRSADPIRAAAPPETDLIRAIYEGLTEVDATTLEALPAAAESWTSSEDQREWTFVIREGAKWSDGEPVTAEDFVRSWNRVTEKGKETAKPALFYNIKGFAELIRKSRASHESEHSLVVPELAKPKPSPSPTPFEPQRSIPPSPAASPTPDADLAVERPGVFAEDERTLKVNLVEPDPDLPKLLAHPAFRPVAGRGGSIDDPVGAEIVTNGPFKVTGVQDQDLTLEKSETYWNKEGIRLDSVKFIVTESAEKALEIYRAGGVDAVTNADLAPLALKLLAPFDDFQRTTHAALNFYEFNLNSPPFDDPLIRESLSLAIDRTRLVESDLAGAAEPAYSVSPFSVTTETRLVEDKARARELMNAGGFPDGEGFPTVQLVVNRNDLQLRIARSVGRMWKETLGIETRITQVEPLEMEKVRTSGEFDLIRRNVVYQTTNELAITESLKGEPIARKVETPRTIPTPVWRPRGDDDDLILGGVRTETLSDQLFDVDDDAFRVMPLYFPVSFSLIKPYILGFEMNSLDAPAVREVMIDNNWQLK